MNTALFLIRSTNSGSMRSMFTRMSWENHLHSGLRNTRYGRCRARLVQNLFLASTSKTSQPVGRSQLSSPGGGTRNPCLAASVASRGGENTSIKSTLAESFSSFLLFWCPDSGLKQFSPDLAARETMTTKSSFKSSNSK